MSSSIDQMVNQLRAVAAQATVAPTAASNLPTPSPKEFAAMLKSAVDEVNAAQMDARMLSRQFQAGDPNVNLQDVVLSLQKASLSFQAMVQVRNRLVSAYQDIMSMQV